MRFLLPVAGLVLLAACAPDAAMAPAGFGASDYATHLRSREAQARAGAATIVPPPQVHSIPGPGHAAPRPGGEAAAIAAAAVAAVRPPAAPPGGPDPLGAGPAWAGAAAPAPGPVAADTGWAAPVPAGDGTIYRDQVLDMQTARATREAELAAFERRRAEFRPVAPTALPERPADVPNIVAFALATTNAVGQPVHRRSRLTTQNHARNCAAFANADRAQEEFLRRGGPERDPLNLDPDGDGFACRWSPEPFRAVARAAN